MEFTLLYSGELYGASSSDTRAPHKHSIRRSFHPQLRRLWETKAQLRRMLELYAVGEFNDLLMEHRVSPPDWDGYTANQIRNLGLKRIAKNWSRSGYDFVPLVTEEFPLRCAINISLLRPQAKQMIMNASDMDAKLKTIFDALRMPIDLKEAGGQGPQEDEAPFYCLLADDKLVTDLHVETDELLTLPLERTVKPADAFAIIHVSLKPTERFQYSWVFE